MRSINYQMKAARFRAHRDLAGFNFADSAVDVALVKSLHRYEFITDAHNVVFIGGPAVAKRISPPPSACRPSCTISNETRPLCTSGPLSDESVRVHRANGLLPQITDDEQNSK